MKKTLALLVAMALLGANAYAADVFSERAAVVRKLKSNAHAPIEIGFYPGSNAKEELFYWSQRNLPFANYVSLRLDTLVTLIPETNISVLKNLIKAQRYKWLFVNPDLAVVAQEIAYTPIVKQSEDTESVLLVRPDSQIHKYLDLRGRRLGLVKNTSTATLALAKIADIKDRVDLVTTAVDQQSLLQTLDSGRADAIAIRKELANEAVKKNPTKYRLADSAGVVPGFVLLAHVSVSQDEVERMRSTFLSLRAEDSDVQEIMSRNGENLKQGSYFVDWDRDYLKATRKALATVEPDYGRYLFDPMRGMYMEANKLFINTNTEVVAPSKLEIAPTTKQTKVLQKK